MRRLGEVLVAVLGFTYTSPAHAWGDDGHRIIGEIAAHYLNPKATATARGMLTDPAFATLSEAATWADAYARTVPSYEWASPLHYVNVPPSAARFSLTRDCERGCVVSAIERFRAALTQGGDELASHKTRQEALYFLLHFVGDIHQPLHVSHPDGKGGNTTFVEFFGQRQRAHWVWDEGLIRRGLSRDERRPSQPRTWQELAFELRMELEPRQVRRLQRLETPEAWANESLTLAKQHAALRPEQVVGDAYVRAKWALIRRQLQSAGVRLAALLNATLGSE